MPTTTGRATDFITFSRTSNATVTDRDGKIKWAGHNLLTNSESFDASVWGGVSITKAANTEVAPNGTTTGDTITTSATTHSIRQTVTVIPGVTYTFAFWVKRGTMTDLKWGAYDFTNSAIITGPTSYYSSTSASGWALVSFNVTIPANCTNAGFYPVWDSGVSGTVYLWGAHLYRSDLGGMVLNPARGDAYYPTTPRNLLGYTEDFSNAAWTKTAATISANAVIAPNGLQTADTLAENTANDVHSISQSTTATASTNYSASVYLKYSDCQYVTLSLNRQSVSTLWASAIFDLVNGTVSGTNTNGGGTLVSSAISAVGGGWYRCSIIGNIGANTDLQFYIATANAATGASFRGSQTFTGTNRSVYLWGAQLSDSASLDAYSPVYGAAVTSAAYYAPRLDYDANGSALGLLVEEQRTNLALQSAAFDVGWTTINLLAFGSGSVANAIASPDGTVTADLIVPDTTSGQHGLYRTVTTVSGTAYTQSVYAKAGGYNWLYMTEANSVTAQASFNISAGVLGTVSGTGSPSATITPVGNGWYRCALTFTPSFTLSNIQIRANSADGGANFAGNGTSGIYIWGGQIEAGAFVSSYIPTGASTATRTVDVASVSTQAFPYSAINGTWVAAFQTLYTGTAPLTAHLINYDGSGSKRVLYFGAGSDAIASFDGTIILTATGDVTGSVAKSASSYTAAERAVVSNGGTVTTGSTVAGYSTASIVYLGSNSAVSLNGWLRQITYIPRRLSNSELQARTV